MKGAENMAHFTKGDRVRVTVAGFYTGAHGTIQSRYASFDRSSWYSVTLDPEYTGGEMITASFAGTWLKPEHEADEERPNKAIYYP